MQTGNVLSTLRQALAAFALLSLGGLWAPSVAEKNSYNNIHPAWSPDGSKIVFMSDRDGDIEIYVMDADGLTRSA